MGSARLLVAPSYLRLRAHPSANENVPNENVANENDARDRAGRWILG